MLEYKLVNGECIISKPLDWAANQLSIGWMDTRQVGAPIGGLSNLETHPVPQMGTSIQVEYARPVLPYAPLSWQQLKPPKA
jgi:hypothetical protein